MNSRKFAAGGVLITGIVLGLTPFAVDAARRTSRPDPTAAESVVAVVRDGFKAGDCAVVRPAWFNWPLSRLRGLGAGTETWPFPALLGSEDLEPIGLGNCERIWWMSFFGSDPGPAPLLASDIESEALVPVPWLRDGVASELRLFTTRRSVRLRTLSDELADANVFRGARGGEGLRCRWRSGKHRCESDGWLDVGLESRHVAHHEVHWVFAHPGRGEDELRIEWPGSENVVPPKHGAVLIVRAGFSMEAVRRLDGSEVRLEVLVDGALKDTIVLEPQKWLLHRRAWELPAVGVWPKVTFRITADQPGWRELMLEADLVDRLSDSTRAWIHDGPASGSR
jgi:hypothetical protein